MIKSENGNVEINCVGLPMLMSEFTSICRAINKTVENSGVGEEEVKNMLNYAIELAFMNTEEFKAEAEAVVEEISPDCSLAKLIKELEEEDEEDGRKTN